MAAYEMVIGLEVHVELATRTKIFCSCSSAFGSAPNTHCCPVCTGMPGTLPVLNRKVVEFAISAGLALGCAITRQTKFDRKNYFYPDLPKAYQVSQLYLPICRNGRVEIDTHGAKKSIGIHEIHMEEDAGKLTHDPFSDQTLVDYNRCGVPLLEIVSDPDMRSPEEAVAYLEKLRATLQYLGVSDCKMQEGSLRADINLSVRPVGQEELGTRTEMKNLNSFKAIARAITGEYRRQVELLEEGKAVRQETRRWDDNKDASFAMRSKEDAQDYRYFPEPDLVPIVLSDEWIERIRRAQPELMDEKIARYQRELGLPAYDAHIITAEKTLCDLFERAVEAGGRPKDVSNWIMGELMAAMKERCLLPEEIHLQPTALAALVNLVAEGRITRQSARDVFAAALDADIDVATYVKEHGIEVEKDDGAYETVLSDVLASCDAEVRRYRAGEEKLFGFLVGRAMKVFGGRADPKRVAELLRRALNG